MHPFWEKMQRFLIHLSLILLPIALPVSADHAKIIKVGAFNFYPGIFKDSDGQIKGFYTEMLEQIAQEKNWEIKYVFGTWNDGLERIKNNEVDLLTSVAFTQERAQYLSYGSIPLLTVWSEVYVTPASPIDGLLDLKNKKIAVMKGDFNAQNLVHLTKHLQVEALFIEFPDFDQVMQAVKDGKVDAGVVNSTVGAGKGRQVYDLKTTGIIFNPFDIFFATSKNTNLDILTTLDAYLEKWKKDEHSPYYTTRAKWTHASDKQVFIIPQWLKITTVILICCIIAALAVVYFLKKRVSNVSRSLQLTHQQYRDVFDSSPVALWVENMASQYSMIQNVKKDFTSFDKCIATRPEIAQLCKNMVSIVDANSVAINKYGITPGNKHDAIPAIYKSGDVYKELLRVLWNNDTTATSTVSFVNIDRKHCEVLLRLSVGTDNRRDYQLVYFTLVDITELVSVQNELIRQKNELSAMLSCIGDAVMTFDMRGNIISMNSHAMELIGKNNQDYKGFSVNEWLKYKVDKTAYPPENQCFYVPLPDEASIITFTTQDKKEYLFEQVFKPLIDEHMNVIGTILLLRDVTQIHKIMEQVQKYDRLDSIGLLAGGIAHDFNNLLGGMFGYLELLRDMITDQASQVYLNKTIKVFDRAKNLTNQLLTFSKSEMLEKKTADISGVVKECVNFALSGSETTRDFRIDPHLAACEFDVNQISQVIDNITINAAQAMNNSGHLHVEIDNVTCTSNEVKGLEKGNYVCISIKDQGPGIPESIIDKIFDPFFTTKKTGNGLGLATSYAIMKKHKGMITAYSNGNNGALFKLYLPVTQSGVADNKTMVSEHRGSGYILILDDEESILETVSAYVSSMGYTTFEFSTGDTLIAHAKKMIEEGQSISGFILDLTLPGSMNGRQCLEKIRDFCKEPFVIAMSGYTQDSVIDNPRQYGFCYSIRKPFLKGDIARALNHCVKEHSDHMNQRSI
jgi:signal transduction histidine kinase/ABC-type amino acid transport substrate-binding protein/ActR/RegA family two-component response regulator